MARAKAADITRIGIFAAITCILSQISIPLPFTPVQLSLGLLAVFMTGTLLPPKSAFMSQIVYLMLGAMGLPVFQGFVGGIGRLAGPTGGYLIAYPLMALAVSLSVALFDRRSAGPAFRRDLPYLLAGHGVALLFCYSFGSVWLSIMSRISMEQALVMAVYPFVPLDVCKALFCTFALFPLRGRILGAGGSGGA